ncbi:MAG: hypothetical protein IMW85_03810 [Thermicanus sp.]|nr:hypothetical protein [Thermicanus sp.]
MSRKKKRRGIPTILLAMVLLWTSLGSSYAATVLNGYEEKVLVDESIGSGIQYVEKSLQSQDGSVQRLNIVTADLSNENVEIITSKPKDVGVKLEPLSMQIARERFKGKNVVAGINADMFDMSLGDSIGMQVKDGKVISAPLNTSYHMFGIDGTGAPFIQHVATSASFTVIDSVYESVYGASNPELTINLDGVNEPLMLIITVSFFLLPTTTNLGSRLPQKAAP